MNVEPPVEPSLLLGDEVAPVVALLPVAPEEPLLEESLEELLEEDLVVPVADTVCPTSPDNETIVPSRGAYSFVSSTACSSLLTVNLSVFTLALAEARFASRVAALCVDFDASSLVGVAVPDSFVPVDELDPDELEGAVVAGVVVVFVVVVVGLVVDFGFAVGALVLGVVVVVVGVVVAGVVVDVLVVGDVVGSVAWAESLVGKEEAVLAPAETLVV